MQAHHPHRRPLVERHPLTEGRRRAAENVEGAVRRSLELGILARTEPRLEHHRVARRLIAGEGEISVSEIFEGRERRGNAIVPGRVELGGEAGEAIAGDLGEQRVAVAEMAVGRRGADAGKPRRLGETEPDRPMLLDELAGGLEQDLFQVAVVIGARPALIIGAHVKGFYMKPPIPTRMREERSFSAIKGFRRSSCFAAMTLAAN